MRKFINVFKKNIYICGYVYKYTLSFAIIKTLMQPINAAISIFTYTYSLKYIIDSIQCNRPIKDILVFLGILLSVNLLVRLIDAYLERVLTPIAKERLKLTMQLELFRKSIDIDLKYYDNTEYYNEFTIAFSQAEDQTIAIFDDMMSLLNSVFSIISLIAVIVSINFIGIIVVMISILLSFTMNIHIVKLTKKRNMEAIPFERRREYVKRIFYLSRYAKDVKLYNLNALMLDVFKNANQNIKKIYKQYSTRLFILKFVNQFINNDFLIFFVLSSFLIYQTVILKIISYGTFATIFNASNQLKGSLLGIVNIYSKLSMNCLFIDYFMKFIKIKSKSSENSLKTTVPENIANITMNQLNFCYEQEENYVLKGISLQANPGEKIALIGYNGAGKTTLMNLLVRLYDISDGELLLNGVDIDKYEIKSYRDKFGVVFQDYQIYATTLEKNISMSDMELTFDHKEKMSGVLKELNMEWVLENQNFQTQLTKEFYEDGLVFSGGNEQRLAIARVLYKDCNYIILDEPSSALDPIAEYKLIQTINTSFKDQTVFFITHRLSTACIADRILVIENGKIAESGTHDELINLDGIYCKMYRVQAEKYL